MDSGAGGRDRRGAGGGGGGPPLAMYLLPRGLTKEVYAGTTSLFFTVGNATKALPWLLATIFNTPAASTEVLAGAVNVMFG